MFWGLFFLGAIYLSSGTRKNRQTFWIEHFLRVNLNTKPWRRRFSKRRPHFWGIPSDIFLEILETSHFPMRNQQCFHHPSRSLSLKLLVCRSFVPAFWVAKKMSEALKKPKQQHVQRFLARCLGTFFWLLATFSDFILVESNLSFLVLNFLQAETEKNWALLLWPWSCHNAGSSRF